MDGGRFDELVSAWGAGAASRRQVSGLLTASVLEGVLARWAWLGWRPRSHSAVASVARGAAAIASAAPVSASVARVAGRRGKAPAWGRTVAVPSSSATATPIVSAT